MLTLRLVSLITLWAVLAAFGLAGLLGYEFKAAPVASTATEWPSSSGLILDASRPTLVVFVHPHCPCSRASLAELNRLIAECGHTLSIRVVLVGAESARHDGANVRLARDLPIVQLAFDHTGRLAEAFQAAASGEAILFDCDGRQLYHGGLTASRGHEGDNIGREAIAAIVRGESPPARTAPVFGCRLSSASIP